MPMRRGVDGAGDGELRRDGLGWSACPRILPGGGVRERHVAQGELRAKCRCARGQHWMSVRTRSPSRHSPGGPRNGGATPPPYDGLARRRWLGAAIAGELASAASIAGAQRVPHHQKVPDADRQKSYTRASGAAPAADSRASPSPAAPARSGSSAVGVPGRGPAMAGPCTRRRAGAFRRADLAPATGMSKPGVPGGASGRRHLLGADPSTS